MKLDGNKQKAIIGTLVIHALIILALIFLAMKTPLPLPKEQGIEVSFGSNPRSNNKVKPTPRSKPKPTMVQKKKAAISRKSKIAPHKNLTQNVEKAPALPGKKPIKKEPNTVKRPEKVKKEKPKPKIKENKVKKSQPVINQRALFKLSKSQIAQSKGIGSGPGGMENPRIEQSKAFKHQGSKGNGISYSLGNRNANYLDKPSASFNEQGAVVVKIWVNPQGKVIRAMVSAKGTTVLDERLRNIALQAARNSSFVSDPSAPAEQIGTITYTFILKR